MFKLFRRAPAGHSDPLEAHAAQRRGAVLLDVREAHEWREGHARGARHLPLSRLQQQTPALPAETEVHVICAHGRRSLTAARLLRRAGFTTVYSVRGGTTGWQRAGLPFDR
jgi:sulfur-carrier protein adenylyltransferase/sulfurtransferase